MISYTEFRAEAERTLGRSLRGREIVLWYKLWRAKYYTEPTPPSGSVMPPIQSLRDWLHSGGGSPPRSRTSIPSTACNDPTQGRALSPEMKANIKRAYKSGCRVSIYRLLKYLRTVCGLDVDVAAQVIMDRRVEEVIQG